MDKATHPGGGVFHGSVLVVVRSWVDISSSSAFIFPLIISSVLYLFGRLRDLRKVYKKSTNVDVGEDLCTMHYVIA